LLKSTVGSFLGEIELNLHSATNTKKYTAYDKYLDLSFLPEFVQLNFLNEIYASKYFSRKRAKQCDISFDEVAQINFKPIYIRFL
jgi:hypothetical protein